MGKIILIVLSACILFYVGLYIYFYSIQDDKFKSVKLAEDHKFNYKEEFEELNFKSGDKGEINALLFKAGRSRGVICFWKGNGGNLDRWGKMAPQFLKYNYDVIITDYREHGKSKGEITIDNFYSDSQIIYDFLKTKYSENKIIVVGYSLGTNIASHLAVDNNPSMTILIEPREKFGNKYLEAFFFPFPNVNRFPFRTDLDIQKTKSLVIIIAGTKSDLYGDAIRLKKLLSEKGKFFEIRGANHASILSDEELDKILESQLLRE